jgi:lipopolysaccharide biosynthesis protein
VNLTNEAALDHAERQTHGSVPNTHRCITLMPAMPRNPFPLRIALHLHIFCEVADEFIGRLNAVGLPMDLFITTTDADKRAELAYLLSSYHHGRVNVLQVPNRGRDIGPLLVDLETPVRESNYELIGHLHSTGRPDLDGATSERWKDNCYRTLLGSETIAHLFKLFIDDKMLGLVFAEERHACGWNGSRAIASDLAKRTTPPLKLPAYPCFPPGTMFWARTQALAPLWSLKLQPEDFPSEPGVAKGTTLDALERLLPPSCEAAGYSWCTVYNRRCSWQGS